ncbi:Phosphoribosylamine-glycine ligase [Rhizobium grahamii CCGE 502]|uniref:Phosphoribosylamine-glycine ligase n=1 Tax=Rhizobium grahamii CCGE 502 TaxID=990285 RepID=S3HDR3_9HYPH|nr:Phosphoribosylamine-glycine ligase [Rhizobium grahamii CCGE 502]
MSSGCSRIRCRGPFRPNFVAAPQDWSTLRLNHEEADILAGAAHILRFGDNEGESTTPIKAQQLLVPRRHDDRANDLWTVWNVVQENAIKGGLRGVGRDDVGRPRRVKSRAVNGIDQDTDLQGGEPARRFAVCLSLTASSVAGQDEGCPKAPSLMLPSHPSNQDFEDKSS